MATYIRNEIAQYSEITMKMNFNKFSDRQIKNILKQIKNGAVSYGHSATATVAKWLLGKYPMPHFRYDSYYIKWQDLPNGHPFFSNICCHFISPHVMFRNALLSANRERLVVNMNCLTMW